VRTLRRVYRDEEDFLQTIIAVVKEIQALLLKTKPHPFWDKKRPKEEREAGAALRMLFEAYCTYKNIRIYQEDPSRSGDVDFTFAGISQTSEHLTLIYELKHAHSSRLERGLTRQLPKYIAERDAFSGLYSVLWYKGEHFDEPATYDSIEDCLRVLRGMQPRTVRDIHFFDVAFHRAASKL
jgi:hypothetical protein